MKTEKMLPEDYTDPVCPFCTDGYKDEPQARAIPLGRVLEKLDAYLGKNDYDGAERHLKYWLGEADADGDGRGAFALKNELMGLYRKVGKRDEALEFADAALELAEKLGIAESAAGGTAFVNAATVYKAFGMPEKSLELFERAREVYERELDGDDSRLGGLYNNMGLTLCDLRRFDEARELYSAALRVMEKAQYGEAERAITYLNLANLAEAQYGLEEASEEIGGLVERARELLESEALPRNGYYAFVCEKCAPTFGYYGYFIYAKELRERAEKIYAGA